MFQRVSILVLLSFSLLSGCGQHPLTDYRSFSMYQNPSYRSNYASVQHYDVTSKVSDINQLLRGHWIAVNNKLEGNEESKIEFFNAMYNDDPKDYRVSFDLDVPGHPTLSGEIGPFRTPDGNFKGKIESADFYVDAPSCSRAHVIGLDSFIRRCCYATLPDTLERFGVVIKPQTGTLGDKKVNLLALHFANNKGEIVSPEFLFAPND